MGKDLRELRASSYLEISTLGYTLVTMMVSMRYCSVFTCTRKSSYLCILICVLFEMKLKFVDRVLKSASRKIYLRFLGLPFVKFVEFFPF